MAPNVFKWLNMIYIYLIWIYASIDWVKENYVSKTSRNYKYKKNDKKWTQKYKIKNKRSFWSIKRKIEKGVKRSQIKIDRKKGFRTIKLKLSVKGGPSFLTLSLSEGGDLHLRQQHFKPNKILRQSCLRHIFLR